MDNELAHSIGLLVGMQGKADGTRLQRAGEEARTIAGRPARFSAAARPRNRRRISPEPAAAASDLLGFRPVRPRVGVGNRERNMNGLGGLNKSPEGVVIGLVQLQLPVVATPQDLAQQTERIVAMVGKARRNLGTMDLVVFPEYSLHGLSMDTNPAIMCRLDGPEVSAFKTACIEHKIWGCFSIMEFNPGGYPYNSGLVIDDHGEIKLYYRKLHPWIPVEPWEPGDLGIPVIDGPKGAKLALIICHDGMFPEMARECAYKGAEIMIRTAGYTAPIRESWRFTNQANAFQNLMVTANVCMCGSDGSFDSMGEGMIVNFDGSIIAHGTTGRADEIITAEVRPDLVREARIHWGVENNIYQLWHRGYVAVKGGAMDCPYTFMQDMVAGTFRLPWEDQVKVTDGTSCGFPAPTRMFATKTAAKAAE
jgi:formamidase